MNNLIVLPMIIPLITAIILIFFPNQVRVQYLLSLLALAVTTALSAYLLNRVHGEGILRLDFGDWPPPFGILFVADSLALLLVLTASLVTALIVIYAFHAGQSERNHPRFFYPLVLFLVTGVNGSFLTGDIFNLFVCFEVLLLASYALISLGGRKSQLRESVKYIGINVFSSWLFLVAIAYLYGTVGTLNMAHLSERLAEAGPTPLLTVISILFLIVFSLKAGLLLYFWLPGSYSVPPTAVAALFGALLTKVGIYALFRVFSLLFYHDPLVNETLLSIMAVLTLIGGSIGAIAHNDIRQIVSYNVIIGVGFILTGLAISTPAAIEGSIYYLIHDMLAKALLFLIAGTLVSLTGTAKLEEMSGLIRNYPLLGWLFFITLLSLVGIPPLSGFIGKVLLGEGAIQSGAYLLLGVAFLSSLFVLYSLLRIFLNCFWGETTISEGEEPPLRRGMIIPGVLLALMMFALGLGAEWLAPYVQDASTILLNPNLYIEAILYR